MYDGGMNLWYEHFFFLSVYMYRNSKIMLGSLQELYKHIFSWKVKEHTNTEFL